MRFGIDVEAANGFRKLKRQRVGAIVNPTSVDARFVHLIDLLAQADGVKLSALFGPEHGLRGEAQSRGAVHDVSPERTTRYPTDATNSFQYVIIATPPILPMERGWLCADVPPARPGRGATWGARPACWDPSAQWPNPSPRST